MPCGCELLDQNGQPATWADAGLTAAQTEITDNGWENEKEGLHNDLCLSNHFPIGAPTMQDDEISRVHTMDVLSPYVKAPEFREFHTDSTKQFNPDRYYNADEISAVISADNHTGCSPRAISMLVSGSEDFRGGTQYIVIEDARQCILKYRGKWRGMFAQYLRSLVRALPKAAMRIREWNTFVTVQANGWNASEMGNHSLRYTLGQIPSEPDAVAGMASLRNFERHLRNNDYTAAKLWHIDERVFRSMMLFRQFNGSAGFALQSMSFMGPQLPSYAIGSTVDVEGVSFRICDLPMGYIRKTGPSTSEFVPIDPRRWVAVNRGVRSFGDSRYEGHEFTDDHGQTHKLISPIWTADRRAYDMRPFGGVPSTPVTDGAEAWSMASKVQFIGGADLDCNVDRFDFQPRLKQAWKLDPKNPRNVGIFWSALPGEELIANRIGLDKYAMAPLSAIGVNPGRPVDGLTCREKQICAAENIGALPLSKGVLTTECEVVVEAGTTLLKLTVTRNVLPGEQADGAVTLAWATAAGTATAGAGNEYTTASGTLSWADEECGPKQISIVLLSTATPGTQFNVNYSGVTPSGSAATLMPATTCTTTIVKFPALPEE